MTAVGYVRVSTEDQAKEGVSLDNQKSKIKAYCQLKDLELREVIEDAGISANNLRRPGVQKVLRLARKKESDAVAVYKLETPVRPSPCSAQASLRRAFQPLKFPSGQFVYATCFRS